MSKQTQLVSLVFALIVAPFCHANDAWKSDFKDGQLGGWGAYGTGNEVAIVTDAEKKQDVLEASFDDSSNEEWSHKGAYTKIPIDLNWADLKSLSFQYKVSPVVKMVGCLLHDSAGNWWRAVEGDPSPGSSETMPDNAWGALTFKKSEFTFQWNDDPSVTSGEKNTELVELVIYVGLVHANEGQRYKLHLADVVLGSGPSK